jgi:hypothetical protein
MNLTLGQRIAVVIAIAVALAGIGWGALLPFDARVGTSTRWVQCASAITEAFDRGRTPEPPDRPQSEFEEVLSEFGPDFIENRCQEPAQDRLLIAGIIVGLAAVGAAAAVFIFRHGQAEGVR